MTWFEHDTLKRNWNWKCALERVSIETTLTKIFFIHWTRNWAPRDKIPFHVMLLYIHFSRTKSAASFSFLSFYISRDHQFFNCAIWISFKNNKHRIPAGKATATIVFLVVCTSERMARITAEPHHSWQDAIIHAKFQGWKIHFFRFAVFSRHFLTMCHGCHHLRNVPLIIRRFDKNTEKCYRGIMILRICLSSSLHFEYYFALTKRTWLN